ncbi:MAG: hypothetical protein ACR2NN_10550 [Bryobacteraceae bacterium]
MMTRTGTRLLPIAAFLASLAVTALFATRAVGTGRRTHSGEEGIRPGMSVPYIGMPLLFGVTGSRVHRSSVAHEPFAHSHRFVLPIMAR